MRVTQKPSVRNCLILLLLGTIAMSGCVMQAPTATPAATSVERPSLDNDQLEEWRRFYDDQFRVFGTGTLTPGDFYPVSAKDAYRFALRDWLAGERAEVTPQELAAGLFLIFGFLGLAGYGAYSLVTDLL